jgi:hypothetical protein
MTKRETKSAPGVSRQIADDATDAMLAALQTRTGLARHELVREAVRFSFDRQTEFLSSLQNVRHTEPPDRSWKPALPSWLDVNVFLAIMFCLGIVLSLIVLLAQR